MSLFSLRDPFQVVPGRAPIVVGAPHHGTLPNARADLATGPIALALAARLEASAVVINDLRSIADANKDPLRLANGVRRYAIRYQNEMFRGTPGLIIEIHGHVTGRYDVEVSAGFDLHPDDSGDADFLERLARFKEDLPVLLASRIGWKPSVGVYPLDRDVRMTATDTFTFQKVRRARHLVGLPWYGLHIEMGADLRTDRPARSAAYVAALADGLGSALGTAFEPFSADRPNLPTRCEADDLASSAVTTAALKVAGESGRYLHTNVAVAHPDDLLALDLLDGDAISLRHGEDVVRSTITPSYTVHPGSVSLPARVRGQLSVEVSDRVWLGRLAIAPPQAVRGSGTGGSVVVGEGRPTNGSGAQAWLTSADMERLGLQATNPISLQRRSSAPASRSVTLAADEALRPRRVALSNTLLDDLVLTLGEVITLGVAK